VDRHAKTLAEEMADRMLRERRYGARVDVRRWAKFQGDALVADVGCQRSELHHRCSPRAANVGDRHVLDEPDTVADAMGTAVLQRLPYRRRPERLACMDRDREVLTTAQ